MGGDRRTVIMFLGICMCTRVVCVCILGVWGVSHTFEETHS